MPDIQAMAKSTTAHTRNSVYSQRMAEITIGDMGVILWSGGMALDGCRLCADSAAGGGANS
jgi:hypothetical protein